MIKGKNIYTSFPVQSIFQSNLQSCEKNTKCVSIGLVDLKAFDKHFFYLFRATLREAASKELRSKEPAKTVKPSASKITSWLQNVLEPWPLGRAGSVEN